MANVFIIIPLYNKEKTIERTIRSIQRQRYGDWEIIVVDDGSTDRGPDKVIAMNDGRIRLIRQENAGPGAARNRGVVEADSPCIAFLDADDEWEPWYLENAIEAIERERVTMVMSMYLTWPDRQDFTVRYTEHGGKLGTYRLRGDEDAFIVRLMLSAMAPWNCLLRRDRFFRYDGFYTADRCRFGEDQTFFLRMAMNEPFAIIGPAAVRFHTEDSDLSHENQIFPLPPYLQDPEVVMAYCPEHNRELFRKVLDIFAIRFARIWINQGQRIRPLSLLMRFPGTRAFKDQYRQCIIHMIPGIRTWWRIKNRLIKCFNNYKV